MRDFDDNDFPLAYLITFRCYGTWLHGDVRGSMDRQQHTYAAPKIPPHTRLEQSDFSQRKHPASILNSSHRALVESAIREVCDHRKYLLHAINVRTNHVHAVVTAMTKPEPILNAFKSYSTRAMRLKGVVKESGKLWSRHGSTVYLWKERDVAEAIQYVMFGQGDEVFTRPG